MGSTFATIRLIVELFCGLLLLAIVLGVFLVAAFVTSPYVLLGMGIVFGVEAYRRIRYNR